jgi:hypothetical protein
MNTNVTVSDIRDDLSKIRQEIGGQVRSVSSHIHPVHKRKMLIAA